YISDVTRAGGGSTVRLTSGTLSMSRTHAAESFLLRGKGGVPDYSLPIAAGAKLLDAAKPFLADNLRIGLSGGRDSRLVTALALHAELKFKSHTAVPPMLEADIAKQLHERSRTPFEWEVLHRAPGGGGTGLDPRSATEVLPPILERAESWFSFTGGDNWATYIRRSPIKRRPIHL